MSLALATREDRGYSEEDNWNDIHQHEDLICVFIEHELRKFKVCRTHTIRGGCLINSQSYKNREMSSMFSATARPLPTMWF